MDVITMAIRSLAGRCRQLGTARLEHHIDTVTAATLMAAIGDNAHRIRAEAAIAKLCGICRCRPPAANHPPPTQPWW
jgi:hypothetical protein